MSLPVPSKWPWLIVAVIVGFMLLAAFRQVPDLSSDAATCILTAAQFEAKTSPRVHTLVDADPSDLARDRVTELAWWPSSYERLPYAFHLAGADWGRSLQLSFLLVWGIGVSGWCLYFHGIVDRRVLPWLFGLFLLLRYSHNNLSVYDGGEFLFWGVFPWILLLNLRAIEQPRLAAVAGLLTPALTLVKYSAGLSLLGLGAAWLVLALKRTVSWRQAATWALAAGITSFLLFQAGIGRGANPASVRDGWHFAPLAWIWQAWLLAITDLEILLMKILVHREQPLLAPTGHYGDGYLTWLLPLSLASWLWFVLSKPKGQPAAEPTPFRTVAFVHLIVFSLLLALMMATGSKIHMDARFLRPAAIAVLPFVFNSLWASLQSKSLSHRVCGWTGLAVLFCLPAAYGAATLGYKTVLRPSRVANTIGPAGIRHELLGPDVDAAAFFTEILGHADADTVIYLVDHGLAIPLAERRITVEHALARDADHLRGRKLRGCPAGGLLLVIPKRIEQDGKLVAIQAGFRDVKRWRVQRALAAPGWLLIHGSCDSAKKGQKDEEKKDERGKER